MPVKNNKDQESRVKDAVNEAKQTACDAESEQAACQSEELQDTDDDNDILDDDSDDVEVIKGLFGRKKDKKDEKIEELTDKLTRQMAEFDNFRKRTEKEKSQMYEIGARDIIEKLLPIVDNFERGLEAVPKGDEHPFMEGMDKVYRHLMTTLEGVGVKPIEAVGYEFNPDFHNAVMHVEDDNYGENTVIEELQKGYTYRDNVIRHSMVKVAN